jgi:hypothetical protein
MASFAARPEQVLDVWRLVQKAVGEPRIKAVVHDVELLVIRNRPCQHLRRRSSLFLVQISRVDLSR